MRTRNLTIVGATFAAAIALSGCGSTAGNASSTATPTTTPSPAVTAVAASTPPTTPEPTAESTTETEQPPASTANLLTSCDQIGSAETRATTIDYLEAQPSSEDTSKLPSGAVLNLNCSWFAGDVSGISATIATVTTAEAQTAYEQWSGGGAVCEQLATWSQCRFDSTSDYQGNTITNTKLVMFNGTDTWVEMTGSNMDITALAQEVGTSVFG